MQVVLLERSQPSSDSWDEHEDQDVDDGEVVGGSSKVSRRPRQGWEWSIGKVVRAHTHDVHALAIHEQTLDGTAENGGAGAARKGPVLVSGGVDASLWLYSVPGFKIHVCV